MPLTFQIPGTMVIGGGARHEVAAHAKRLGAQRVLLVTDDFLVRSGQVGDFVSELELAGLQVTLFSQVQPDPTVANVVAGCERLRAANADLVIALGGGSPIDAAKAIAVLATNPPPITQYAGYHRIPNPGVPLIAVPTTAGTGSEATRVAVITDTDRNVKLMILDGNLLPRVAVVDYELTMSMPRALTAHVGVDTLTHAIEAFVSRKASVMTDAIALSSARLTAAHLLKAYESPDNHESREAMALAACQGGMAFSNSSVCLVHGMSRPIGAIFHVPHGLSNAVLLPEVTRFSLPGAVSRYAIIAREIGAASRESSDEEAGAKLLEYLDRLNQQLEIGRLRDVVKVSRDEFEMHLTAMAEAAIASGSPANNPRLATDTEIIELYRRAW